MDHSWRRVCIGAPFVLYPTYFLILRLQRHKLKAVSLSSEEVQRLVDSHVLMYFDGFGGPNGKG